MSHIIQEAVTFSSGVNFQPISRKLRLPETDAGMSIYLLSSSYEYDIHMIKTTPPPKLKYKHVLIPNKVMDRLGSRVFRFFRPQSDLMQKIQYIQSQKITPPLIPLKAPYKPHISENLYIPMSDFMKQVDSHFNMLPVPYVKENIFDLFQWVFKHFNSESKNKILIIDTNRFRLNKAYSPKDYQSGLINALMTAYLFQPEERIPKIPIIILFRYEDADYKFDLSKFNKTEINRMKVMLKRIGKVSSVDAAASSSEFEDTSSNTFEDEVEEKDPLDRKAKELLKKADQLTKIETEEDLDRLKAEDQSANNITSTIQAIAAKFGKTNEELVDNVPQNAQEKAEEFKAQSELFKKNNNQQLRLNPTNFKKLNDQLTLKGNNPVENNIMKDAVKNIADTVEPVDTTDAVSSITSPREAAMRNQLGQIKLNNIKFDQVTEDIPIPKRSTPRRLTTTNPGALKGTGFSKINEAYEKNLLQKDIVSTLMHLSTLPDGFYVTNVEVTDISSAVSSMDNWKVTLKSKSNGKSNVINMRIPKLKNGRFYMDGMWWNIGKQDFPIPILKVNNNEAMVTSNYNKMSVTRYETKSLVTISALIKILHKLEKNPYVTPGSSVQTNIGFISTIEYDEYAKRWFSFKHDGFEIYFNRSFCLKQYNFVSVQSNEFCCGMNQKVPIVVNTDTGLLREGNTLTDLMISILPKELQDEYRKTKPGKLSMYTNVKIMGIEIPVGVAVTAWEGLTKLIARANIKAQYVPARYYDPKYFVIPFKDRGLAIPNTISNQLLFNGFYRINTKAFNIADFEVPIMSQESVFIDIFNNNFFRDFPQLTTFITNYQFFVDVITKEVCHHYNIPDDICGMLIYASNLLADNNFSGENNTSLYRIRSSEIIPAIIHYRLAHEISSHNNKTGSKHKSTSFKFDPGAIIRELREIQTVNPVSSLNPIIELHSQEIISKKGFRGVNNDRTYTLEKRTYDSSMVGKMAVTTSNDSNVGINRQLVISPKASSLRGYTSNKSIDDDFDDLELASFSELATPGTVSRDDSIRTAIATSQTAHMTATADAQPVLIANGVDEIIPGSVSEEFAVMAEEDGTVVEMDDMYMIIQYKSGRKQAINIGHKTGFNVGGGFYVDNQLKSNFQLNEKFKQNDILAYHPGHFSKDSTGMIRLNIGPMMKVAFAGLYSTYEDAGLITTKASKRLASNVIMKQVTKIDANDHIESVLKVGDEVEIGDPLIVFGLGDSGDKSIDKLLSSFGGNADDILASSKRVVRSKHSGVISDIRMYTIRNMDSLSPSIFKLLSEHFKRNIEKRKILDKHDKSDSSYKLDTLYNLPTGPLKSSTIKGITTDVSIEIDIIHPDEVSVGDKLAIFGASKQICSEVIPEGMEPYTESAPDEEVSIFIAPSSILKRMIPSMTINAPGNKVLMGLKKATCAIWNN